MRDLQQRLLVDTYDKGIGLGLLDYYRLGDIEEFVAKCHQRGLAAWVSGSISKDELPGLWETGVDAVCVRGAACEPGTGPGRFGQVSATLVRELVATIPAAGEVRADAARDLRPAERQELSSY
jgi:uncharacterized protein (UPF0264 family)